MTLKNSTNNSVSMKTESNNTDSNSNNKKRDLSKLSEENSLLDVDYDGFSQLDEGNNEINNSEVMQGSNTAEITEQQEGVHYSRARCMEELTEIENSQLAAQLPYKDNKDEDDNEQSPESPLFPPSQLLDTDFPDLPSSADALLTENTGVLELEESQPTGIPVDETLPPTQPLPAEILSQDFKQDNYLGRIRYTTDLGITLYHPIFLGSIVLIGRQTRCHIRFNNNTISSEQVTIKTSTGPQGTQVLCYNMGSNPTEVNGVIMEKNSCIELRDQSTIVLNHCFVLQYRIRKDQRASKVSSNARYTVENHTLGVGAYGQVKRARDNVTGQLVAVKTIKKISYRNNKATDRKDKIQAEIDIMKPLNHPNVLKVLGVEEDEESIRIFLPYIPGGDLFGYITSQPDYHITEDRARFIFWQLVKALQYLHQNQICHRDIKPENILIHNPSDYPKVVLCDFGMAKKYNMDAMKSVLGTWNYSAPEIVENLLISMNAINSRTAFTKRQKTDYSYKVDSWSMGVLLFAMLSGSLPFHSDCSNTIDSQRKLFRLILRGQFNMNKIPRHNISFQGEEIIRELLCLDPESRLNMIQCENHSWIKPHLTRLMEIFEHETHVEASAGPQVLSQ